MTRFNEYIKAAGGLVYVATEEDDQPSVRIMGFAADPKRPNHWFLLSQPDAPKVQQLALNDRVAIITPLDEDGRRIESNRVTMNESGHSWADVADFFADHPVFFKVHQHPENEVLYEMDIESARLASYTDEEDVTF
ncbi:pyridoxamine 5'-phosphate oxidase family protein [Lactobacillaceae bacterium L1_55_11]|nr:pyridoxamine 5'-phosphate oxidase family protein [Lactobacillaceae bacterium L1_55_11]